MKVPLSDDVLEAIRADHLYKQIESQDYVDSFRNDLKKLTTSFPAQEDKFNSMEESIFAKR